MSRESKAVIILQGSHSIHALYGISSEIYHRPSINLQAKVGISKKWFQDRNHLDLLPIPQASDYIVGKELNELESKGEIQYSLYPIRERKVVDWNGLIALWHHILFQLLPLRLSANDSHVLLSLPTSLLTRSFSSHVTSIFFQRFNCAGFSLIDTPLMSCYASGTLTGASIDLGYESIEITPVVECLPISASITSIGIGTKHLIAYLASLMSKDSQLMSQLEGLQPSIANSQVIQIVNSSEVISSSSSPTTSKNFGSNQSKEKLLLEFVESLFSTGQLRAPTPEESGAAAAASRAQEEDDEVFDVAAALVAGKEKDFVEEQERKKREAAEAASSNGKKKGKDSSDETVVKFRNNKLKVKNSLMNRLTDPLFKPSLLDEIVGSFGIGKPSESILFASREIDTLNPNEDSDSNLPISIQVLGPSSPYTFQNLSSIPSNYSLLPNLPLLISQSLLSNHLPTVSTSPILFDSLLPHGSLLKLNGFIPLLLSSLSDYLAENPENKLQNSALAALAATREENLLENEEESLMNEKQPTNTRALKTPDWFPEYKERGDIAPFLGGIIYGRIIFTDPYAKSYISKQRFNEKGPSAGWIVTA